MAGSDLRSKEEKIDKRSRLRITMERNELFELPVVI